MTLALLPCLAERRCACETVIGVNGADGAGQNPDALVSTVANVARITEGALI